MEHLVRLLSSSGEQKEGPTGVIDSLRFTSPERGFMVIEINHMESCVCALEMGESENEGARTDVTEKYEWSDEKMVPPSSRSRSP